MTDERDQYRRHADDLIREEPTVEGAIILAADQLWDRSLVAKIRAACAREFGEDPSYDFFHLDYLDGESPDDALLRLFREEWQAQRSRGARPSVDDVIYTLING